MPNWNTPAGLLTNSYKGEPYSYILSCNASTYQIIAGKLPDGLILTGPGAEPGLPYPSIWGIISTACITGNFTFTIRAFGSDGTISDRAFTIGVWDIEPTYSFPTANLGVFPDGNFLFASIFPIAPNDFGGNISIVSGGLPANLCLQGDTGIISGYVNPSVLYNTGPIYTNIQPGAPNVCGSANSKVFSFEARYDAYNTANYYMTIQRVDLF